MNSAPSSRPTNHPSPQATRRGRAGAALPLLAGLALLAGCGRGPTGRFQGYVEGEFVYLGAPLAGTLTTLAVSRGAEVTAGQMLFELEHEAEAAALREAEHRVAQAQARLADLQKGRRPSELASLEAQLQRAQANLSLSTLDLRRREQLRDGNVIAPEELDAAKSRREADRAQAASLEADLATARLGARADEIAAAQADVEAAQAAQVRAQWAVTQKRQAAPTNAVVQDTLYRPGEFVPAGNPVVALLPPTNVRVRFFVPQAELVSVRPGRGVLVTLDGYTNAIPATVNYVSPQAEFTPPVIYSQENRAKFVFMVEATFRPGDAPALRPGQPADVRLN